MDERNMKQLEWSHDDIDYRGGTTLTVSGQDLDVVSEPVMLITMVHSYMSTDNPNKIKRDVTMKQEASVPYISFIDFTNRFSRGDFL